MCIAGKIVKEDFLHRRPCTHCEPELMNQGPPEQDSMPPWGALVGTGPRMSPQPSGLTGPGPRAWLQLPDGGPERSHGSVTGTSPHTVVLIATFPSVTASGDNSVVRRPGGQ